MDFCVFATEFAGFGYCACRKDPGSAEEQSYDCPPEENAEGDQTGIDGGSQYGSWEEAAVGRDDPACLPIMRLLIEGRLVGAHERIPDEVSDSDAYFGRKPSEAWF
jgi:hypothetical protein